MPTQLVGHSRAPPSFTGVIVVVIGILRTLIELLLSAQTNTVLPGS
jgi:hypothetical protein